MRRLLIALLILLTPVVPAKAQTHQAPETKIIGYFNQPEASPTDRAIEMSNHGHAFNLTMNVRWCHPEDWTLAGANGLKVLTFWPDEFRLGDSTAPPLEWGVPINWDRPMWTDCTRPDGSPLRALDWYTVMVTHRDQIAAFLLADEWDCNYRTQFPYWTPQSCELMALKIEWNAASLRGIFSVWGWFPPIHVNYTAAFIDGLRRGLPGYRLPGGVDWFGFDSYAPWDRCWGAVTCPQLLAALKARMAPSQRLVLIPRVFSGAYLGWAPSDLEVVMHGLMYVAYAQADPQVIAVLPFIEWGPGGAGSVPLLKEHVKAWGRVLTGRQ